MYKIFLATLTGLMISVPAMADKPETAGKGKPAHEQMESHQQMGKGKDKPHVQPKAEPYRLTEEEKRHWEEKKKNANQYETHKGDDKSTGMDKQHDKKAEQMRKELDKGSEQGQQSRADNSKKWWKFW